MRATLRLAALTLSLIAFAPGFAAAQNPPSAHQGNTFTPGELVREGHRFFGTVSRGLAQIVDFHLEIFQSQLDVGSLRRPRCRT